VEEGRVNAARQGGDALSKESQRRRVGLAQE
jgi:hypothetical protein